MKTTSLFNSVSWFAGFLIFIIGVLNILRGNDTMLGLAFITISFLYIPASNKLIKKLVGFSIHHLVKIILVILLLWISMAVGAIAEGFYPEIF